MSSACERVPAASVALERLLARRRELESQLLTLDAEMRWGARTDEARARVDRDAVAADAERARIEAELVSQVRATRAVDPEAVVRWADAHVALLDRFLHDLVETQVTERAVAEGERRLWRKVRRGTRDFVDENTYFVRFDPALFEALFGFDPSTP